jgi:hypothetical protein
MITFLFVFTFPCPRLPSPLPSKSAGPGCPWKSWPKRKRKKSKEVRRCQGRRNGAECHDKAAAADSGDAAEDVAAADCEDVAGWEGRKRTWKLRLRKRGAGDGTGEARWKRRRRRSRGLGRAEKFFTKIFYKN